MIAFHPNLSEYQSTQEGESDSPPEYTVDDSGDESDDVVGYDLTDGHYNTVTDRDRRERRDHRLANRRRRREHQQGPWWEAEEVESANIQGLLLRQCHHV